MADNGYLDDAGVAQVWAAVKQHVADEGENKADIDGYYSQLTAGLAENLIGRGDAVPAEYLYRTAGGTADIEDGIATIDCIKGNTLVWNQMLQAIGTGDWRKSSAATSIDISDGVLSVTPTAQYGGANYRTLTMPAGHTFLLLLDYKIPTSGSYYAYTNKGVYFFACNNAGVNAWQRGSAIATVSADKESDNVVLNIQDNRASDWDTWSIKNVQLFDLTLMFGAGNEPATVEEFEAMFPLPYYPYSAPKLLPVDIRGVETVGFNAYDPSTGEAELLGGHQYQISGTYTSLSYSTGESIALDSDGIFTPSENGTLTVTGGNATDTCVHLVWSGYRNGEYEEHWSAERPIDTSRFFPTGLKKVGDKADALYADHYDTVIGAVDLGTLTWYASSVSGIFSATVEGMAINATAQGRLDGLACANYPIDTVTNIDANMNDKTMKRNNGLVYIRDNSYTTAADFKAAMSGVILYYELATPTTTPIDPPLNLSYKVSDFGIERIMVDETADAPQTAPVPMEVEYGINAIDTIRRLPKEYQSHKSMGQFTAALESSLGIDITETWDEDDQRYEYEIDSLEVGADKIADGSITGVKLAQDVREAIESVGTVQPTFSGKTFTLDLNDAQSLDVTLASDQETEDLWTYGENMLPRIPDVTAYGITVTTDEDGTIHLSGTTTGNAAIIAVPMYDVPVFNVGNNFDAYKMLYEIVTPAEFDTGYLMFKVLDDLNRNAFSLGINAASAMSNVIASPYTDSQYYKNFTIQLYNIPIGTVLDDVAIRLKVQRCTVMGAYTPPSFSYQSVPIVDGAAEVTVSLADGENTIITNADAMTFDAKVSTELQGYYGKRWACFGDSLTQKDANAINAGSKRYFDIVAPELGLSVVNYGRATTGYSTTGNVLDGEYYKRMLDVNADLFDFMTIMGSTNDVGGMASGTIQIGSYTDTGTETVCGCINTTIDNYYSVAPMKPLGIISMLPTYAYGPNLVGTAVAENYVNALKQIAANRGIPFLDLYHGSGMRPWDTDVKAALYQGGDGIHPNNEGIKWFAPMIREFVKSLI